MLKELGKIFPYLRKKGNQNIGDTKLRVTTFY